MSGTDTSKRQTSLQPQEIPIINPHILCPTLKLVHARQCTNWVQTWSNLTIWVGAPSSSGEHAKAFRTIIPMIPRHESQCMTGQWSVVCPFHQNCDWRHAQSLGFMGKLRIQTHISCSQRKHPYLLSHLSSPAAFGFWDRFSLCSPDWTEIHYVAQAGLRLTM